MNVCSQHPIVSNDEEPLVLVDAQDREIGYLDKASCHDGPGVLHRAFSLFVFDSNNRLLLQQRAAEKRLWGGFWSNSCCSHPRQGEAMADAVNRRLEQELGIAGDLSFAYKFEYQASFGEAGSEHELCWVYVGRSDEQPAFNPNEIEQVRWLGRAELDAELKNNPDAFTPWFKLEWAELARRSLLPD